jgi:hypothetical protein
MLKAHFAKLAKNCLYQRDTPPTNGVGGYKSPDAPTAAELGLTKSTDTPAVDLDPTKSAGTAVEITTTADTSIAAETARLVTTIPDFLKRSSSAVSQPAATGEVDSAPTSIITRVA